MYTKLNSQIRKALYWIMLFGVVFSSAGTGGLPSASAQDEWTETPTDANAATVAPTETPIPVLPEAERIVETSAQPMMIDSNVPLYDGLIWNNLGDSHRSISINKLEPFEADGTWFESDPHLTKLVPLMDYYFPESMSQKGWTHIHFLDGMETMEILYYNPSSGQYLSVLFAGCTSRTPPEGEICTKVWISSPGTNPSPPPEKLVSTLTQSTAPDIVVRAAFSNPLPVPFYSQRTSSPDTKNIILGFGSCTASIWNVGCTLTSHTMIYNYFQAGYTSVTSLNDSMKVSPGLFVNTSGSSCYNLWPVSAPDAPAGVSFSQRKTNACWDANCIDSANVPFIDEQLAAGKPMHLRVHTVYGGLPTHSVVLIGHVGNDYIIKDPWGQVDQNLTLTTGVLGSYIVDYIDSYNGTPPGGGGTCNTNPSPNSDQVGLYADDNYCGSYKILGVGEYTNPAALGFGNDSLSSIKVGGNVKATLCKDDGYSGGCEDFTSDDPSLGNNSIGNDSVSSAKVVKRGSPLPSDYGLCAEEGARCNFSGTASIYYGANNQFLGPRTYSDGVDCNNNTFGSDPISGTHKQCFIKGGRPQGSTWCADENGTCSFGGSNIASVYYGANGKYNTKTGVSSSITCNNGTFGDPFSGIGKACYYVVTGTTITSPTNPNPADNTTLARTNNTVLSWTTNGTTCVTHIWGGSIDISPSNNCGSLTLGNQRGGAYNWQVTASNASGSATGPTWHFNIKPYPPTNVSASVGSSNQVNLSWTLSSDDDGTNVDGYDIYKNSQLVGTVNKGVNNYQVTGLTCNTNYSFYVLSKRQNIQSDNSGTVSATIPACLPDLLPYAPSGYPDPVVSSSIQGTHATNTLYAGAITFFDWHFINSGSGVASGSFYVELWVDDTLHVRYPYSNYGAGWTGGFDDWAMSITTPGWHTIKLITDPDNTIAESDETNNIWTTQSYWDPILGWKGEYFNNATLGGNPWLSRDDLSLNFDWGTDAPEPSLPTDNFSARWTKTIFFNQGDYKFDLFRDDGIRLKIDGEIVLEAWQYGREWVSKTMSMTQGNHTIVVEAFEIDGLASAIFRYTSVAPTAITGVATNITTTGATLNGTVNANNASTTVTFQYGLTTSYGSTATATQSPVSGTTNTAVSAVITGLTPNTLYHFRAVAVNAGGTANGSDATFTTQSATLATPSGLGASTVSSSQINLSWTDNSTDETNFRVERSLDGSTGWIEIGTAAPNTPGYSSTGLAVCTTYYYRVRAYRSSDTVYSGYSNIANAKTTGCSLPAPTLISPVRDSSNPSDYTLTFQWNPSSGAIEYLVEWWGGPYGTMQPCGWSSATSCYVGTVWPGYTYSWHVKARNASMESSWSDTWTFMIQPAIITPPLSPTEVDATDGTYTDKVQVSWSSSSDATYYEVYRNTSDTPVGASLLGSPNIPPHDDTSAIAGTSYWYFVKACNSGGCSGFSSSDSGYRNPGSQVLTVSKAGSGSGTVTSSPPGINCGATCSASFANNAVVTLTAAPISPSIFTGWSVVGCSGNTCAVTMDTAKSVTANFEMGTKPLAFRKSSPAKGAKNQTTSPTLSWASSSGATEYWYCYDTTNDGACSNWVSNGTATSTTLSGLALNTSYYWHVKAVNTFGTTYSNGTARAFWSFRTGKVPGTFKERGPANGAVNKPTNLTLIWGSSAGTTEYWYCYDTTNDNACSDWVNNGKSTKVALSGLAQNTTYYWHVRAVNNFGTTYSNFSETKFWSFKTKP